jgi:hypothetical protein
MMISSKVIAAIIQMSLPFGCSVLFLPHATGKMLTGHAFVLGCVAYPAL